MITTTQTIAVKFPKSLFICWSIFFVSCDRLDKNLMVGQRARLFLNGSKLQCIHKLLKIAHTAHRPHNTSYISTPYMLRLKSVTALYARSCFVMFFYALFFILLYFKVNMSATNKNFLFEYLRAVACADARQSDGKPSANQLFRKLKFRARRRKIIEPNSWWRHAINSLQITKTELVIDMTALLTRDCAKLSNTQVASFCILNMIGDVKTVVCFSFFKWFLCWFLFSICFLLVFSINF